MSIIADSDANHLVESIWGSVFNMEVSTVEESEVPDESLTGVVHITGDWEGAVILRCSQSHSRTVATKMFGVPIDEVNVDDIVDVMCELTNMTGGGVKAVLSGNSALALPMVIDGSDYRVAVRNCELESQFSYDCDGEPVVVEILRRTELPVTGSGGASR